MYKHILRYFMTRVNLILSSSNYRYQQNRHPLLRVLFCSSLIAIILYSFCEKIGSNNKFLSDFLSILTCKNDEVMNKEWHDT